MESQTAPDIRRRFICRSRAPLQNRHRWCRLVAQPFLRGHRCLPQRYDQRSAIWFGDTAVTLRAIRVTAVVTLTGTSAAADHWMSVPVAQRTTVSQGAPKGARTGRHPGRVVRTGAAAPATGVQPIRDPRYSHRWVGRAPPPCNSQRALPGAPSDSAFESIAQDVALHVQVVLGLQVQPEPREVPK